MLQLVNLLASAILIAPAMTTPLVTNPNTATIANTNRTLVASDKTLLPRASSACNVPEDNCPINQEDYLLSWEVVRPSSDPDTLWGRAYLTSCGRCVPITKLDNDGCFEYRSCTNNYLRRICFNYNTMRAERVELNTNPIERQCYQMSTFRANCADNFSTMVYWPSARLPCA